ncbi:hypothetical protein WMY93_015257 [Mugilogobius chulae]|uniref:Uncharacterized protein n=1 Tax=Mugilogobius chulae TaxID=88201 RepID=A0AAW0P0Z7_9GOBI
MLDRHRYRSIPELEEDDDFEDSDEEMELQPQRKTNKRKHADSSAASGSKGAKKKKKGKSETAMFASAEEFGSLLDENSGSKLDHTGLNAMRNSDKAGAKQLKWETQRDDWIHDRDAKTLRRKKSAFGRKRKLQTGNRKFRNSGGGVKRRK